MFEIDKLRIHFTYLYINSHEFTLHSLLNSLEAISDFLDRPLQGKDLHQMKNFQVSKAGHVKTWEIQEQSTFIGAWHGMPPSKILESFMQTQDPSLWIESQVQAVRTS